MQFSARYIAAFTAQSSELPGWSHRETKNRPQAVAGAGRDALTLKVRKDPAQRDEAQIAGVALGGVAANALTARTFAAGTFGKPLKT